MAYKDNNTLLREILDAVSRGGGGDEELTPEEIDDLFDEQ